MIKYSHVIFSRLLLSAVVLFSFVSQSPCAEGETQERYVRAGHAIISFPSEVDKNDAKIALELSIKVMSRKFRREYRVETVIFDNLGALKKALQAGELDMVSNTGLDYLEIENDALLEPALVGISGDEIERTFIVLVRKDSGINKLSQLKGKKVLSESGANGQIGLRWLDTILMQEGFLEARDFFKSLKQVEKVSMAVLPVFFKQDDACVVSLDGFKTIAELNPQVGRELVIMATSPPLLDNVISFHKGYNKEWKEDLIVYSRKFHEEPEGEQILMLFRKSKLIPYKPDYLENIRTLQKDYQRLKAKR